jgi:ATP diphosphatase
MKSSGLHPEPLLFSSADAQACFGVLWETAGRVQEAASRAGFDWETRSAILDKLAEELEELRVADREMAPALRMEELGDLLFVLIHYAWWAGIPVDRALEGSMTKFRQRFGALQAAVVLQGRELGGMSPEELESLWQEVKRQLAALDEDRAGHGEPRRARSDV